MKNKIINLLLIISNLSSSLIFCAAGPVKPPCLWKLKKGNKVIYLSGTIHFSIDELALPRAFKEGIKESSNLLVEVNLNDSNITSAQERYFKEYTSLPEGMTFSQDSSPILSEALEEFYHNFRLKFNQNINLRAQNFYCIPLGLGLAKKLKHNLDRDILNLSQKSEKRIFSLEDPRNQLKFFSIPYSQEEKRHLEESINPYASEGKKSKIELYALDYFSTIEKAWLCSDLEYFVKANQTRRKNNEVFYKAYISDRNKILHKRILEVVHAYDEPESSFVAVGVAHLVGKGGLLDSLTQSGYAIIPLA